MSAQRFFACLFVLLCLVAPAGCEDGGGAAPAPAPDGGTTTAPTRPITEPVSRVDPDEADKPTAAKLEPAAAALGSIGPTVVVTGTGFVPRSVVRVDGVALETSFRSETELAATIPTEKLAEVGELAVSVRTPAPGGGDSEALPFAVENPPPEVIALDPLSVVAGSGATKVTVVGTTFVRGSKIMFGTTELATTFKDAEHLEGTIPPAALTVSASVPVSVTTPAPGGGASTKIAFTISNPSTTIESITPNGTIVGSGELELIVKGTGFVGTSTVLFNTTKLTPMAGGTAGELKVTVPASATAFVGDLPVAVENPPPGGGVSEPVVFSVTNPAPVATSVTPPSIPAGSGQTPVTVNGSGFVNGSKVIGMTPVAATTFVSATQLRVTLTPAHLAKVGSLALKVQTSAPGGGTSADVTLELPVAAPKVTAVEPSSLVAGAADTPITIRGSLFVAATTATAGGQPLAVTYKSGSELSAVLPAALLAQPGPIPIVVTNAGATGGSSAPANVTVGCDPGGDVVANLTDTTTIHAFDTELAGAPLLSRWTSDGTCPNVTLSPVITKQPGRFAVVQNGTAGPITLSAWADCTNDGKGAAFLALYRRASAPASDPERQQCTGFVADGSPHVSPDSGGSANCPGLTKANGGGITLAACERAVVHIQPFDFASTTFTPPPTLKIRAE
ncbi:MAG: IPT/TIG domain-containing protein [Labilithrix sp.]|nr:IPT/TIG domain-containing protein [Labilithrix sp.]MCW5818153.1 IPT/TIG domain-containing protein [Labilithrix sp.]